MSSCETLNSTAERVPPALSYLFVVCAAFIEDDFNLTGLQDMPYYHEALDAILDVEICTLESSALACLFPVALMMSSHDDVMACTLMQ